MKTQTIEQAVEKRFNGSNIFWKVILKNLTPETISFIKDDYTQALQAQRDAAVWEALLELEGEARLAIVEWENSADYDHTTNDGLYSFIRQISLKREALTPPTK